MAGVSVKIGACCFCGREIEEIVADPCRVTVETAAGKWQVWTCRGACLRQKLADLPQAPGRFEPAHF